MKFLTNALAGVRTLGVGRQLGFSFATLLALMVMLGALSIVSLMHVDTRALELADKWLSGVGHVAQARSSVIEMRDMEVKHSRTGDSSYHSEYEEKIAEATKAVNGSLAAYKGIVAPGEDADLLAKTEKAWAEYQKFSKQVIALGRDKQQTDAADISDGAAAMALDETLGSLSTLSTFNFDGGHQAAEQVDATYKRARIMVMGLLAVALVVGVALAMLLTRSIVGQLGGEPAVAVEVARAVAAGDLSTPVQLRAGDTLSLMASLHAMQQGLAEAVRQVRQGSDSVATASVQIAEGNQDLSGRTEQQASALQQTAATMDELGGTVRNNADNARQASELARGAADVAARGGDMVGQVVQTMKGINDSSKKIADIIGVIDGIAFQTNILALNAAVEAARAGEQGRGFAVVASEVRSLAQRSAEAAKEIKSLIGASVERVEQGSNQVDQAGRTMQEIVAAVERVSAIVGEISAASVEQSSGVSQVSDAVTQMDQATQQNAALVEQSAAAAESLKQQAQQLVQAVAVFRLA
jgi:methyl-accepting chemotaxis protein